MISQFLFDTAYKELVMFPLYKIVKSRGKEYNINNLLDLSDQFSMHHGSCLSDMGDNESSHVLEPNTEKL